MSSGIPTSELMKRTYSEDEIECLYELGRFSLENGELRRAETIFVGLTEVAPDFASAWLGLVYVFNSRQDWDGAIAAARQALRIDPQSLPALLMLTSALLNAGDVTTAGSYLGEIQDRLEEGETIPATHIRIFKALLARHSSRG